MNTFKKMFTDIQWAFVTGVMIVSILIWSSCKKGYLDVRPSKALLVPTTISDFDALLDNLGVFNIGQELNEIASDDLFTTNDGWAGLSSATEQNTYIYANDVYQGATFVSEWNVPYQQVFTANVVLDGLKNMNAQNNPADYDRVKGTALFSRGFAFYGLSQLFTKPYNSQTALTDPGIPIRLTADVNQKSVRGTLQATFEQIISDLKEAVSLLPVTQKYKSRPSKAAAQGMLSRIYLSMGDYVNARVYADSCLSGHNKLYDYNTFDTTSSSPFPFALPDNGDEIIYYTRLTGYSYETSSLTFVDSNLYNSYAAKDLRRPLFFMGNGAGYFNYKGTYEGNYYFFGGLATDEIYLNRAECYARAGNTDLALKDLNTLLSTRWVTGTFTNFAATSSDNVLAIILQERRKELIARGLRWSDLRRLENDPRIKVIVNHTIDGVQHLLAPGDKHFIFPIPDYEIKTSGIQQN